MPLIYLVFKLQIEGKKFVGSIPEDTQKKVIKIIRSALGKYIKDIEYNSEDGSIVVHIDSKDEDNVKPKINIAEAEVLIQEVKYRGKYVYLFLVDTLRTMKTLSVDRKKSTLTEAQEAKFISFILSFDFGHNEPSHVTFGTKGPYGEISITLDTAASKSKFGKQPPIHQTPQKKTKKTSPSRTPQKKLKKVSPKKAKAPTTLEYKMIIKFRGGTSQTTIDQFWDAVNDELGHNFKDKYTLKQIKKNTSYSITIEKGRSKVETINKKLEKVYEALSTNEFSNEIEIELTGNEVEELIYA